MCEIFSIIDLKGLFTNFEYITFFSCPTERNIFYKRFISIKPLWLEIIEKKGCTKSVRVIYIIYIIVLGRTDFVHPFFSIISSQSGFIEMDLLQKMFLLVGHEKNVIYSKLVNNPFNYGVRSVLPQETQILWQIEDIFRIVDFIRRKSPNSTKER